jgi:hypothetical protein
MHMVKVLLFSVTDQQKTETNIHVSNLGRTKPSIYVKGKAIPLQAWTGPEGSRRLRLPDFMTIGT